MVDPVLGKGESMDEPHQMSREEVLAHVERVRRLSQSGCGCRICRPEDQTPLAQALTDGTIGIGEWAYLRRRMCGESGIDVWDRLLVPLGSILVQSMRDLFRSLSSRLRRVVRRRPSSQRST